MQHGTHPGPSGHPSKEGSRTIPSLEGCRVSGGVGSLFGAREQKGEGYEPSHIARFILTPFCRPAYSSPGEGCFTGGNHECC